MLTIGKKDEMIDTYAKVKPMILFHPTHPNSKPFLVTYHLTLVYTTSCRLLQLKHSILYNMSDLCLTFIGIFGRMINVRGVVAGLWAIIMSYGARSHAVASDTKFILEIARHHFSPAHLVNGFRVANVGA